jgi:hypothetical protein
MSFFLNDANGYLGDFGTHQGIRDYNGEAQPHSPAPVHKRRRS